MLYKQGDIVYFISNLIYLRKATVICSGGGFYTIKFEDTEGYHYKLYSNYRM